MSRAMLVLDTEGQRRKATDWVWAAKNGSRVEFKGPRRTLDQNSLLWALLTDVAVQMKKAKGLDYSTEQWKHIFLHAWGREVTFLPALDGNGVVPVPQSSSDLSKEEMTDFIEFILKEGAERGVTFHNPHEPSSIPEGDEAAGSSSPQVDPAADQSASSSQESGRTGEDAVTPAEQVRASSPAVEDEPKWLRNFARMILPAIEVDEEFVIGTSKGAFVEGLSDDTRTRAREITRIAREVCRGERPKRDGAVLIASKANCDIEEIAA